MTRAGVARKRTVAAVRDLELRVAADEAEEIRRAGDGHAEAIIMQARAEAAALIERRCAVAERLAEREARDHLADARARARGTVLRAQRSALTEARMSAHANVRELAGDPGVSRMLECLAADARKRLAPAGPVELVDAHDGGFVARAGNCEIDCSLGALLDRVLDSMADELERLWR
ncbi:MAG TPA: V-type ATP synthase subunit E family protein [Solirubrobacteraceae bacterium]|nr:V-type ATP synthase subunit E family protein [Solirubrobacteraceae bacterium]